MKKYLMTLGIIPLLLGASAANGQTDFVGVQQITKSVAMETRDGVGISSQPFFVVSLIGGDLLTVVMTQEPHTSYSSELYLSAVNVRNHQHLQIPWKEIVSIQRFDPRNVQEMTNSIAGVHGALFSPCAVPGLCGECCGHLCCSGDTILGIVVPSSNSEGGIESFSFSDDTIAAFSGIDTELLIDQIAFEACLSTIPSNWLAFDDAFVPSDIVFEDNPHIGGQILTANEEMNDYHVGQLIKKAAKQESLERLNHHQIGNLLAVDDSTTFDFDPNADQDYSDDADEESSDEFVFIAAAKQSEDRTIALNDGAQHHGLSPALLKEISAILLEEDLAFSTPKPESPEITLHPYFYVGDELITNAAYEKFVKATGHPHPANWVNGQIPEGVAREGVKDLNIEDAQAYIRWKNQQPKDEGIKKI